MMMRLLSNSTCLGLLTTFAGAMALLHPVEAAQEQAGLSTAANRTELLPRNRLIARGD